MSVKRYTQLLTGIEGKKKMLDAKDFSILQLFCYSNHLSVTDIHHQLNLIDEIIAYKNVFGRVKELESLQLIQKNGYISKYGAICYRLTAKGVYILFLERPEAIIIDQYLLLTQRKSVSNAKNFLNNYGNDFLFKLFVYPFFSKETLNKIGHTFLWDIYDYIHNCCEELQSIIARKNLAYYEKRFSWNAIPGEDNIALLQLLKETLHLTDNINNVDVIKSADDKFITFLHNDNLSTIILELDRKFNRVLVKDSKQMSKNMNTMRFK